MAEELDMEEVLTVERLSRFIDMKGLSEECNEFCINLYKKDLKKAAAVPVGDRFFAWEGCYSKRAYELAGEDFDRGGDFGYICANQEFFPFGFIDPSSKDTKPEELEGEFMTIDDMTKINPAITVDSVFEQYRAIRDGEYTPGDGRYNFSDFGFSERDEPTDDQMKAWLAQLKFEKLTDERILKLGPEDFFG